MNLLRNKSQRSVKNSVLCITPVQRCPVQIRNILESSVNKKVFLYKANQSFDLSLCKGVPGFTELCLNPYCFHKGFIIFLPYWMSFQISLYHYALHVVSKDILGNSHILKSVNHSNKQIFLLCIWKKLHISLAAVVANHRKAGHLVFCSIRIQNLCKAPIHLECFTRPSHITTSSISLRRCLRSPNRYQIFVSCNVILYGGSAASKALPSETFQAHYRIGNSLRQKTI